MRYFITCLFLLLSIGIFAQSDSTIKKVDTSKSNSIKSKPKPITVSKDTVTTVISKDTLKSFKSDSLNIAYTDSIKQDSLQKNSIYPKQAPKNDTSTYAAIMFHKYSPNKVERVFMLNQYKIVSSKEFLFYLLTSIVTLVALIRISFPKYFFSIWQLFLQTSFRQKQTREQLLQDNLASLLMNFLFICSVGTLIALVINHYNWVSTKFWILLIYSCLGLLIVYVTKYLLLLFFGWIFNVKTSVTTYLFIVFLTNKVIGVVSIPFLFILAFSIQKIANIALIVIAFIALILLIYRYVVSLGTIRTTLKVNALHFFIYLCAVEVMPIVLMYKAFINIINQ